jgi:hypothetical protein
MWCGTKKIVKLLYLILYKGEQIMATIGDLTVKVGELSAAQVAEAQRQNDRAAAVAIQLVALQKTIDDLKAAGGLTPEQQASLDAAIVQIDAVTAALNAA